MIDVDVRTRTRADIHPVVATDFFERTLPAAIGANEDLAVPGAKELPYRPFALVVDGDAWTLTLDGDHLAVTPGSEGAHAIARIGADDLADLVHDLRTPMTFMTAGELDMPKGNLGHFLDFWVVLRSLLDARPVYTRGSVSFRDRDGSPLDLTRGFDPDADPADVEHFLAEAGFVHLRGVFTEAEMAAVSAEMDAAAPRYAPDDGRSWWATTAAGEERLVRMMYFHQESPTTAALLGDDRFLAVGRLTGQANGKPGENPNIVEALVKPIGVVQGISDVPWHKDCSLGSHSYRCCSLTVGVSITGADADSGQLRVVAGSHRALVQPAFVRSNLDLPQVELPTATGDLTVHLSCTLHMAQPPVSRERRVLYTDFSFIAGGADDDPGERKIADVRNKAFRTVSQPPGHVD